MNELFLTDIMEQAIAAKETRSILSEEIEGTLQTKDFRRIFIVGSGDSYFAAYALQFAARKYQAGNVYAVMSNDAAKYWDYQEGDLIVPISISGESMKSTETAQKARETAATILPITCNPDSTMGQMVKNPIIIPYKSVSRRTPHSTDFTTTLVAIAALIEFLSGKSIPILNEISGMVEAVLSGLEKDQEMYALVNQVKGVNIIGGGPSYGAAQYGAAKFWETGGSKSWPFDVEEVGHGPYMTFRSDELVVMVMPEGESFAKAQSVHKGIQTLGFKTLVVTNSEIELPDTNSIRLPQIDELWSPMITSIPLQYLCYTYANSLSMETSDSSRFNSEAYSKAFEYFRGAEYGQLYK